MAQKNYSKMYEKQNNKLKFLSDYGFELVGKLFPAWIYTYQDGETLEIQYMGNGLIRMTLRNNGNYLSKVFDSPEKVHQFIDETIND